MYENDVNAGQPGINIVASNAASITPVVVISLILIISVTSIVCIVVLCVYRSKSQKKRMDLELSRVLNQKSHKHSIQGWFDFTNAHYSSTLNCYCMHAFAIYTCNINLTFIGCTACFEATIYRHEKLSYCISINISSFKNDMKYYYDCNCFIVL